MAAQPSSTVNPSANGNAVPPVVPTALGSIPPATPAAPVAPVKKERAPRTGPTATQSLLAAIHVAVERHMDPAALAMYVKVASESESGKTAQNFPMLTALIIAQTPPYVAPAAPATK
jgi:hypothetical protein